MAHKPLRRLDTVTPRLNQLANLRGRMPVLEAASRCGVTISGWYRWERGDCFPAAPYLWRIEELLSKINGRTITYRDIYPHLDPALDELA